MPISLAPGLDVPAGGGTDGDEEERRRKRQQQEDQSSLADALARAAATPTPAPPVASVAPTPAPTPAPAVSSPAPASAVEPVAVPAPTPTGAADYRAYAREAAQRVGLDPDLFERQIYQESKFDPNAGSPAGAQGIAQIVPKWHPGVNPWNPQEALDYAADLMARHLKTYGGDIRKALVAYNGGGGAVAQYEAGAPYEESQIYLRNILSGGPIPAGTPGPTAPYQPGRAPTSLAEELAAAQQEGLIPPPQYNPQVGFDADAFGAWAGAVPSRLGAALAGVPGELAQIPGNLVGGAGRAFEAAGESFEAAGESAGRVFDPTTTAGERAGALGLAGLQAGLGLLQPLNPEHYLGRDAANALAMTPLAPLALPATATRAQRAAATAAQLVTNLDVQGGVGRVAAGVSGAVDPATGLRYAARGSLDLGGGGLTSEAEALLQRIDEEAAIPAVMTNNLKRIARENGITPAEYNAMTPGELVDTLRAKRAPNPAEEAAETLAGIRPPDPPAPPDPPRPEPPTVPAPPVTPEGAKERLFAQSVRTAPDTPAAVQESLRADPGSYYVPTSNPASVQAASDLIATDRGRAVSLVMDSTDAPDAVTSTVGQLLVKQAQDAGDYDEAVRLTETLAARATEAGQFIQALGMYGRLTRTGILRLAQKTVQQAQAAGIKGAKLTPEKARKLTEKAALLEEIPRIEAEELAPLRLALASAEAERDTAKQLAARLRGQLGAAKRAETAAKAPPKPKPVNDFLREMRDFFGVGGRPAQPGAARVSKASPLEMLTPEEIAAYRTRAEAIKQMDDPETQQTAMRAFLSELEQKAAHRRELARIEQAKTMPEDAAEAELRAQARGEIAEARRTVGQERRIGQRQASAERRASAAELDPVVRVARAAEAAQLRKLKQEADAAALAAKQEAAAAAALQDQKTAAMQRARESMERQKAAAYDRALRSLEGQKAGAETFNIGRLERQKAQETAKALEQQARDVEFFTNSTVRNAEQRLRDVNRDMVNRVRARLKATGVEVSEPRATAFVQELMTAPNGRAAALLTAEMLRDVQELVPVPFARKLATLQTMAQLLNPKTTVRNLGGNVLFAGLENATRLVAAGLDVPVSWATGRRSVTMPDVGAQFSGARRGFGEGSQEVRRGVNTQPLGTQFDLPQQRTFGDTPVLSQLETMLGLTLRVPDRAFYQAAFDDSLLSSAWVQARNEGKRGAALGARQMELVANPTNDLLELARGDALFRTFQDENKVQYLFSGLKKALNLGQEFGAGDFILKYPRTPANLLLRAAEYSPFGFIEAASYVFKGAAGWGKNNQKGFVESVARATIGTAGLTAFGYVAASEGVLTGRSSKDPDVRAQENLQGVGQYRFNVSGFTRWVLNGFASGGSEGRKTGDTWVTYDWMQPMAVSVAIGAQAAKPGRKTPTVGPLGDGGVLAQMMEYGETAADVLAVGVDTLAQQPLLQGVRRTLGGENPMQSMVNVLKDAPASFVPTLLSQLNQVFDNTVRDTYDPEAMTEAFNRVLAKVPILAATLPASVDVWGGEKDRYHGDTNNPFNVFVNPSFVSQYFPRPEAAMLLELQQATGEVSQFPRDVPTKLTITQEGETATYILSPQQAQQYQVAIGQMTREAFSSLAESEAFRQTDPKEQVAFLGRVLTMVNTEAKDLLRTNAQEAGGGVTPLPPPEPKKASGRKSLTAQNVVEAYAAQKLLEEYDAVPDGLLEKNTAYRTAVQRVEATAPGSVQRKLAEAHPSYQMYKALVDMRQERMRFTNRELEKAGRDWRGWAPLGRR